jgi:hypothetical protein
MQFPCLHSLVVGALALAFTTAPAMTQAPSHYDELANLPFKDGYIAKGDVPTLLNESFFERGCRPTFGQCPLSICTA